MATHPPVSHLYLELIRVACGYLFYKLLSANMFVLVDEVIVVVVIIVSYLNCCCFCCFFNAKVNL